jgi:hypothetical protein
LKALKTILGIYVCLFFAAQAFASSVNWSGESTHMIEGAVIAGGTAAITDIYWPEYREYRGVIGLGVSTLYIAIAEGTQMIFNGERISSSAVDIGFHTVGSFVGAIVTDQYILAPIVKKEPDGGTLVGFAVQGSF